MYYRFIDVTKIVSIKKSINPEHLFLYDLANFEYSFIDDPDSYPFGNASCQLYLLNKEEYFISELERFAELYEFINVEESFSQGLIFYVINGFKDTLTREGRVQSETTIRIGFESGYLAVVDVDSKINSSYYENIIVSTLIKEKEIRYQDSVIESRLSNYVYKGFKRYEIKRTKSLFGKSKFGHLQIRKYINSDLFK